MPATRDGKLWRSQFYYKDWQGVRRKKNKRGFKTKGEADEWERNFLQQQQKNLDISFENFVEIYFADMENRLRESTIINKRYVFSSAAFTDKQGLSVERGDFREDENVIEEMRKFFHGCIISLTVEQCRDVDAVIKYKPSKRSEHHSEIHGSEEVPLLSKSQRKKLAERAKIEYYEK